MNALNTIDELMKAESWQRQKLEECGLTFEQSDEALTELGVNYHELQEFLAHHPDCEPMLACRILATK